MTLQDLMARHFIQVSMDGTEAEASSDGPSVEEVSVSESVSEVGAAFLPVPGAGAGALDQVGQCPERPPVSQDPFSEDLQTTAEDLIDLYVDGQDIDFPPVVRSCLKRVAQLESEVVEKNKSN